MEIYKSYQHEVEEIKKLKAEQNIFRQNIQSYEFKKSENEIVRKELDYVDETDIVYKLVGPMLVQEEIGDAKSNVSKRIEFIKNEM